MGRILVARTDLEGSSKEMLAARNSVVTRLVELGHEVVEAHDTQTMLSLASDADAVYVNPPLRADEALIRRAHNARIIAGGGAGYDHIDIAAATAAGVPVVNAGRAGRDAVAEHVICVMGALSMDLMRSDRDVRAGRFGHRWSSTRRELRDKSVAVVGFGGIGRAVAQRCIALGMNPIVPVRPGKRPPQVRRVTVVSDLAVALRQSHFVTLHVPRNPSTFHLIGGEELAVMRPDAFLINTTRGGIVDERALVSSLVSGQIAGAALDVFDDEPVDSRNPLLTLENVIVTPHNAGITLEALDRMGRRVATSIDQALAGSLQARPLNHAELHADRTRNTR